MITSTTELGGCELGLSNRQNDVPTALAAKYNGRDIAKLPNEILNKTLFSDPQQYGFNASQTNGVISADSPDGKHFVTASGDTAKIFELNDKQCQKKATIKHDGIVKNACFSPDGKHFVTASGDTAKIFELNDKQCQKKATIKHDGIVKNACFSPDGKRLVTVSADVSADTAKISELNDEQWQEKATIVHRACVSIARFSDDGKHLMTVSCDNTAKIYGVSDGLWQDKTNTKHDLQ